MELPPDDELIALARRITELYLRLRSREPGSYALTSHGLGGEKPAEPVWAGEPALAADDVRSVLMLRLTARRALFNVGARETGDLWGALLLDLGMNRRGQLGFSDIVRVQDRSLRIDESSQHHALDVVDLQIRLRQART